MEKFLRNRFDRPPGRPVTVCVDAAASGFWRARVRPKAVRGKPPTSPSRAREADLAELVSFGALVEGQGSCGGEAVVPSPSDGRTVVFAAYFAAGLRLPCDDFLSSVLATYNVRLPQLSPLAFPKLAVFAWMCRTCGFAPAAELFAVLFTACAKTKDVETPAGPRKTVFDCVNFMLRPERSDAWPRSAVSIIAKPNVEIDGTLESRLILLRKVAQWLSTRDLCEEFCLLRISPLACVWDVSVNEGEEVFGLPCLALPAGVETRTWEDAEMEASKMIGALTTAEFARLLQRQTDGRVNRVHAGELPGRSNPSRAGDDEVGTSKKRKRAVAKGGQIRTRLGAKGTVDGDGEEEEEEEGEAGSEDDGSHGYSTSPTPAKSRAARRLHSIGILDGSDEANFFETSSTEKDFNSEIRENLERISRDEEAAAANTRRDPGLSESAAGHEGEDDRGQDHPEACGRKVCVRPLAKNRRNKNEKFMAVKGLLKIKCPFRLVYPLLFHFRLVAGVLSSIVAYA
uniref:Transposase (putative) gypsy type domain-containing protein n=1 Tax=Oryza sativa subsp. japonica TaxID=39947 RepID=Q6Z164_ORYSJ|nr:hypothetical protein [Oryza sativa Japonica Group]BAD31901.1 hypothetical protein [Oryza sativa Japonica Group]